jgi:hypothetical protein
VPRYENRPKRLQQGAPILATRPLQAQARASGEAIKSAIISEGARRLLQQAVSCGPIRFPVSSPGVANALIGPDHDLEFDHSAGLAEPAEIKALGLPFANIGAKS